MGSEKNTDSYMGLPIPIPGQTSSGFWDAYLVQALNKIASHNHTTGNGAPLTQSAFTVSSNFDMKSFGVVSTTFVGFSNPAALTVTPPNASVYFENGNFYIKDGSGTTIQLTKEGAINTTLLGGFTGDYATDDAFCVYSVANGRTYSFYTGLNSPTQDTMAEVRIGKLTVTSTVAGSDVEGFSLETTGNIATSYAWTVPDAQASTLSVLTVSNTGVIAYADATTFVRTTGNQSIADVKTFTSFPITPSSAPTQDYEVANKKFVEDEIVDYDAPSDGTEYVRRDGAWVANSGGSFPEAPSDSKQYARKNAAWDEIVIDVTEAPNDGKQYVRKNEAWAELVTTGGLTPLTASGTLAVNTIYSVDANGDFTFVVPAGSANGDTIQVKRNGYGGVNVFTGTFRNSETALIAKSWNYDLKLTWSSTRSLWIYE